MIRAYDKLYLEKARTALGRMLDYGVNDRGLRLRMFYDCFLASEIAMRFGNGDCSLLAGRSGTELAMIVLEESGLSPEPAASSPINIRRPEFWAGWALAFYQWQTALSFEEIDSAVPVETILKLYSPYHEMDILQFCDRMNELYRTANPETNLKRIRKSAGLSQSQLAELASIPVRTLQQYEQRQKDINKAQAEYLFLLSRALCCRPDALLEKTG